MIFFCRGAGGLLRAAGGGDRRGRGPRPADSKFPENKAVPRRTARASAPPPAGASGAANFKTGASRSPCFVRLVAPRVLKVMGPRASSRSRGFVAAAADMAATSVASLHVPHLAIVEFKLKRGTARRAWSLSPAARAAPPHSRTSASSADTEASVVDSPQIRILLEDLALRDI